MLLILSLSMLLSYVNCGGEITDSSACSSAESDENARNECFDNGGNPLAASYRVVQRPETVRTIDYCRYAETNQDARTICILLSGTPFEPTKGYTPIN